MGIDTAEDCPEPQRKELPRQCTRVAAPEGEDTSQPTREQPLLTVTTDVFQEEVAANDR